MPGNKAHKTFGERDGANDFFTWRNRYSRKEWTTNSTIGRYENRTTRVTEDEVGKLDTEIVKPVKKILDGKNNDTDMEDNLLEKEDLMPEAVDVANELQVWKWYLQKRLNVVTGQKTLTIDTTSGGTDGTEPWCHGNAKFTDLAVHREKRYGDDELTVHPSFRFAFYDKFGSLCRLNTTEYSHDLDWLDWRANGYWSRHKLELREGKTVARVSRFNHIGKILEKIRSLEEKEGLKSTELENPSAKLFDEMPCDTKYSRTEEDIFKRALDLMKEDFNAIMGCDKYIDHDLILEHRRTNTAVCDALNGNGLFSFGDHCLIENEEVLNEVATLLP